MNFLTFKSKLTIITIFKNRAFKSLKSIESISMRVSRSLNINSIKLRVSCNPYCSIASSTSSHRSSTHVSRLLRIRKTTQPRPELSLYPPVPSSAFVLEASPSQVQSNLFPASIHSVNSHFHLNCNQIVWHGPTW